MWKLVSVKPSTREHKKFVARFEDPETGRHKTTHFGDNRYESYDQHHDKERRARYRTRHDKDLKTGDPTSAGYLSFYILWGDSTSVETNIRNYKKLFNL